MVRVHGDAKTEEIQEEIHAVHGASLGEDLEASSNLECSGIVSDGMFQYAYATSLLCKIQ